MEPDVFDVLNQVSKGAFSVFCELKYRRDLHSNIVAYPGNDSLTRTQKETLSRKLKELRSVDLIRLLPKKIRMEKQTLRFPRGTFMINPELLRCSNHDAAIVLWNHITREWLDANEPCVSEND